MSVIIRPARSRGHANHGWLDSHHTFSFADYYDPSHMGYGPLRVINEDRVEPAEGFSTHGHRDMEIISYVIDGELAHKDSKGADSIIRRGDVQAMSAGTGIRHSEFNASSVAPVHFLQVWIMPEEHGAPPRYDQRTFPDAEKRGRLRLIASRDGRDDSLTIRQDADVFASLLNQGEAVQHKLGDGRKVWVQIVSGDAAINGVEVHAGDGAAIENEAVVTVTSPKDSAEILLFDLP